MKVTYSQAEILQAVSQNALRKYGGVFGKKYSVTTQLKSDIEVNLPDNLPKEILEAIQKQEPKLSNIEIIVIFEEENESPSPKPTSDTAR